MGTLINDTIVAALDNLELKYDHDGQLTTFMVTGRSAQYRVNVLGLEDKEMLFVQATFPVMIPEAKRPKMYKFISEFNYNRLMGLLVIDPEDGELSYRISNTADHGAINETVVQVCVLDVLKTLDDSHDSIMEVLYAPDRD